MIRCTNRHTKKIEISKRKHLRNLNRIRCSFYGVSNEKSKYELEHWLCKKNSLLFFCFSKFASGIRDSSLFRLIIWYAKKKAMKRHHHHYLREMKCLCDMWDIHRCVARFLHTKHDSFYGYSNFDTTTGNWFNKIKPMLN